MRNYTFTAKDTNKTNFEPVWIYVGAGLNIPQNLEFVYTIHLAYLECESIRLLV